MQHTHSVAHTRFEVDLDAARNILGHRSPIDLGEVRFHLYPKKEVNILARYFPPPPQNLGGKIDRRRGVQETTYTSEL